MRLYRRWQRYRVLRREWPTVWRPALWKAAKVR